MRTDQPSSNSVRNTSSRREFLQRSGSLVAGSLLAATAIPRVHAAEENTIRLALIGCGGRGSGAVGDACSVAQGPVQLVAMADVIESRMNSSHTALSEMFPKNVDVPPERRFVGFDAYRKAIDCLRPGDVAMLTGYAGFRPVQLEYAVVARRPCVHGKIVCRGSACRSTRHSSRRRRRGRRTSRLRPG